MSSTAVGVRYTPEQYLALERPAEARSEYHGGIIVPRAPSNQWHVTIVGNLTGEIWDFLRGRPGQVHAVALRLHVPSADLYAYPDVMALLDTARLEDEDRDTLLNPAMIAEVLSPATEVFDRGAKFAMYQQLESLQEYVLISQDAVRVERFNRRGGRWEPLVLDRLDDVLRLESIGCEVPLAEIYDKTPLAAGTP